MASLFEWRTMGHLASALLMTLALSCGGGGGHAPAGGLEVTNNGTAAMTNLFVTPSSSDSWGVDQLAPDALQPADTLALTGMFPDAYDVKALFSDGSTDEVLDVAVEDGLDTSLSLMNSGNGAVAVFNNSGLEIDEVYLAPATATAWGPNQAYQPLVAGQTLTLTGVAPGTYALEVVFSTGAIAETKGVGVTSGIVTTIQVN